MCRSRKMRTAEVQSVAVAAAEDSPVDDQIVYSIGPTVEPVTVTEEVSFDAKGVFT